MKNTLKQPVTHSINPSRNAILRGAFFGITSVATLAAFAPQSAMAGGADGTYEIVNGSGSVRFAGRTMDLPKSIAKQIARASNGEITIERNRLELKRGAADRIADEIGDEAGVDLSTRVSGPRELRLRKDAEGFSGETAKPIVVSFKTGGFFSVSGKLKVDVQGDLVDDQLTLNFPIRGSFFGSSFSGNLTLICKR